MKVSREWYKRFFVNSFYNPASPAALERSGFKPLSFWGGFGGERLLPERNRLICLAALAKPRRLPK